MQKLNKYNEITRYKNSIKISKNYLGRKLASTCRRDFILHCKAKILQFVTYFLDDHKFTN